MTDRKDGGPAFPHTVPLGDGATAHYHGYSLRDWFAGQALPQAVEDYDRVGRGPALGNPLLPYATNGAGTREEIIARQAYRYADAMLAERERDK